MTRRLIDADAIEYKTLYKEDWLKGTGVEKQGVWKEDIDAMPTVDAEPVRHGKWILGKCNRCGEHAPFWSMATTYYESNYCPNCGARMDKDDR